MKKINQLVNSQLTRRIENHDKLSNAVYALLHLNKEKHNLWVISKQQRLTIITDNPYLATQISYQQQAICDHLNRRFLLNIKQTGVKIVPPTSTRKVQKEKSFVISDNTASILETIAKDIEDDELKQSLLQLTKKRKQL